MSCDNEENENLVEYVLNKGCSGGNTETAYAYINYVGGVGLDINYPYTSYWQETGNCHNGLDDYKVTVDNYYKINEEADIKKFVMSTGPVTVCVDANDWATYTGGVMTSCGKDLDHCVQLVGVRIEKDAWIVSTIKYSSFSCIVN